MTLRTPHFGPLAGQLCEVMTDGSLRPVGPLPEDSGGVAPPVCLPDVPDIRPGPISCSGEIAGYDTRGSRDGMVSSIVRNHGEQHRAWAEAKASAATRNWDRGIRSGRIARKEN